VVDSPAVSLDAVNRREVGELIPGFFDQMIMFVISTERDGFADLLRQGRRRPLPDDRARGWRDDGRNRLPFFRTFQDREAA
jgi:hypothetical protein